MNDYYFRVKASDRAELRRVLRAINVLRLAGGELAPRRDEDSWVEVGRIEDWANPGHWVKDPVSGEAYWHYNLRTDINVRRRVKDLVLAGDPDALILDAARERWYSKVDGNDTETAPDFPKGVWL